MTGVTQLGISPAKLVDYLLNPDHVEGWSKAKFFLGRGFTRENPTELAGALVWQAMRDWPGDEVSTVDAVKHRIVGPIVCPDGSMPEILTVWQAPHGSDMALLVTARPYRRKGG